MPLTRALFDRDTARYLLTGLAFLTAAPGLLPAGRGLVIQAAGLALERAAAARAVAGLYPA